MRVILHLAFQRRLEGASFTFLLPSQSSIGNKDTKKKLEWRLCES